MLRLRDPQLKLWDSMIAQPELFRLPARLLEVDRMLDDDRVFAPIEQRIKQRVGRPTVPMDCYLRMMYLKHDRRLGYETLVQEVADSLTLRRFCRLDISDPVPHPTTLSRMTRRLGSGFVADLHNAVVSQLREAKLVKGRQIRTDTTVMEADVEYPTDAGLLTDGVRVINRTVEKLKKVGAKLGSLGSKLAEGFRDSTGTMRRVMYDISRFLKKRATAGGQDPDGPPEAGVEKPLPVDQKSELRRQVNSLTAEAASVATRTIAQARELARRAGRRVARAPENAKASVKKLCLELVAWAQLTQRALDQTKLRLKGQTSIPNRMVSIFDPEARPIRKGKLSQPVQFGALVEVTQAENTVITDYKVHVGNPGDQTLLVPVVERHLARFGSIPDDVAADRGYYSAANEKKLGELGVKHVSIPATGKVSKVRAQHQAQGWFKRLQRYRAGNEGTISSLKSRYGADRSRLKGQEGRSTWMGWGVLAHNLNVPAKLRAAKAKAARARRDTQAKRAG